MNNKCVCCGSNALYYKANNEKEALCRNCYNRYRRSGYSSVNAFIEHEKETAEILEICKKIKELNNVIKINYADIARDLDVSREAVRQWFNTRSHVPYEKAREVYKIILKLAAETRKVLDTCA